MNTTSNTPAKGMTPAAPDTRRVFKIPLGPRLLSLFGVIILTVVTCIMIVFAALAFFTHWALGLFMAACAGFTGALTGYVWRDLRGKWNLRVVLDADAVTLDLPAGRSLIHRPPAQHMTIPFVDIEVIETRCEAYGTLGMEMMQRSYVLLRNSGELIFLFEERALATAFESSMFQDIVEDLSARAGVSLREIGMVEGRGGLLGLWGLMPQNGRHRRCHAPARFASGSMRLRPARSRFQSSSL